MTALLAYLAHRKKAITGFLAPGVALLVTDYTTNGGNLPTEHQWTAIGAACLLTAFGVHQITNKPTKVDADAIHVHQSIFANADPAQIGRQISEALSAYEKSQIPNKPKGA